MHKRKTNKWWWIIGVVLLLALGLGSLYVIGSQDHPKTEQTSNSTSAKNVSENSSKTPSIKTTANKGTTSNKTSKNNTTQNAAIPSEFWGTWYNGKSKYAVISVNKFVMSASGTVITKSSLPLQLCNDQGPNGSYEIYHNPNPNAAGAEGGDGNAYWIGYLTIDGKKQRVLACYQRQGVFEIFTSQPTSSSQWIQYDGADYQEKIGKPDLDALKTKADSDNYVETTSNDDEQSNSSGKDDSSNQTDTNDEANMNSTDANQDNSDSSSQSDSNDNSSSDNNSNSQDYLN